MKISGFTEAELGHFREYQRASYQVLVEVARTLKAGETEKDVARRVRKRFHEQGVHHYFHVPVVMFGDRTAYPGDFGPLEALSTDRKLALGMPVIIDAAPIYRGYTVDTSYATSFGENVGVKDIMERLRSIRDLILVRVREQKTFRAIALEVDEVIRVTSDHLPAPGLWAVEPHLGKDGVGAKFEEILVITDDDAYWLDDGGLPYHAAWH